MDDYYADAGAPVCSGRPAIIVRMSTIRALYSYPIKSCAGVALELAICEEQGLAHDRRWMVVDDRGEFLSQREAPRLALVTTALAGETMRVGAPGMLRIELPLEVEEDEPSAMRKVSIWNDVVGAVDEGDYVAQWFSDFLGRPARLVKLHPDARRLCDTRRIAGAPVAHRFADAYPLLVVGAASLDDLNLRLGGADIDAVPMNRFRPNVVIDGVDAYAEDGMDALHVGTVTLQVVQRCVRCEIPCIDQSTAIRSAEPMATLSRYRADAASDGGVVFGVYCIVALGRGQTLSVGQSVAPQWRAAHERRPA